MEKQLYRVHVQLARRDHERKSRVRTCYTVTVSADDAALAILIHFQLLGWNPVKAWASAVDTFHNLYQIAMAEENSYGEEAIANMMKDAEGISKPQTRIEQIGQAIREFLSGTDRVVNMDGLYQIISLSMKHKEKMVIDKAELTAAAHYLIDGNEMLYAGEGIMMWNRGS